MKPILVAFRLKNSQADYTYLFETIKDYRGVAINNWTYVLYTKDTPGNVYKTLRPHLKDEDTLLVFMLKSKWQGRGPNELIDWMLKHL